MVPEGKFQDLSLYFIIDLPLSYRSNSLLIIVDQLTKFVSLLPCAFGPKHPFGVGAVVDLLVHHIVCKYGITLSIVYSCNVQFTVYLW